MARLSLYALATLALALQVTHATKDPKTVCYYESWVHWRTGDGKMDPSEIGMAGLVNYYYRLALMHLLLDVTLCTHIVYTYFGIEAATHELKWLDPYLMKDLREQVSILFTFD